MLKYILTTLHGVLRTLDRKLMPGAEPTVRLYFAENDNLNIVDISFSNGVHAANRVRMET